MPRIVYGSINLKIVLWGLLTNLQVPPTRRSRIQTFFLAQANLHALIQKGSPFQDLIPAPVFFVNKKDVSPQGCDIYGFSRHMKINQTKKVLQAKTTFDNFYMHGMTTEGQLSDVGRH